MVEVNFNLTEEEQNLWNLMRMYCVGNEKHSQPYLYRTFYSLTPISAPGLKTLGVDKNFRCYVDFDFIQEFAKEQGISPIVMGGAFLAHEPWHILRQHFEREENLQDPPEGYDKHKLANIAEDLEINDDIADLLEPLKDFGCFPGKNLFKNYKTGMSMEAYYEKLLKDQKEFKNNMENMIGVSNSEKTSSKKSGEGEHGNKTGHGCGGLLDGKDFGLSDEADEDGAIGENEAKTIVKSTAEDVQEYLQSKKAGNGHSSLQAWAKDVLGHKTVDWKSIFRTTVHKAIGEWTKGNYDYDARRPNRRQYDNSFIAPSVRSPKIQVAIALDVSGSNIGKLGTALNEIQNLMRSIHIRDRDVLFFPVDTKAGEVKTVHDPKLALENVPVGGGTMMTPGYNKLAKLNKPISILITDGYVYDYPRYKPRSKTSFITCILGRKEELENVTYKIAMEQIGSWSKIIPIVIE